MYHGSLAQEPVGNSPSGTRPCLMLKDQVSSSACCLSPCNAGSPEHKYGVNGSRREQQDLVGASVGSVGCCIKQHSGSYFVLPRTPQTFYPNTAASWGHLRTLWGCSKRQQRDLLADCWTLESFPGRWFFPLCLFSQHPIWFATRDTFFPSHALHLRPQAACLWPASWRGVLSDSMLSGDTLLQRMSCKEFIVSSPPKIPPSPGHL